MTPPTDMTTLDERGLDAAYRAWPEVADKPDDRADFEEAIRAYLAAAPSGVRVRGLTVWQVGDIEELGVRGVVLRGEKEAVKAAGQFVGEPVDIVPLSPAPVAAEVVETAWLENSKKYAAGLAASEAELLANVARLHSTPTLSEEQRREALTYIRHSVQRAFDHGYGRPEDYLEAASPDVVIGLLDEIDRLTAKVDHYEKHEKANKRPFSDQFAQAVIDRQVTEIDRLTARLKQYEVVARNPEDFAEAALAASNPDKGDGG